MFAGAGWIRLFCIAILTRAGFILILELIRLETPGLLIDDVPREIHFGVVDAVTGLPIQLVPASPRDPSLWIWTIGRTRHLFFDLGVGDLRHRANLLWRLVPANALADRYVKSFPYGDTLAPASNYATYKSNYN